MVYPEVRMISPVYRYSKAVLKSGKRLTDYANVSKEQDRFGVSASGYFAVLPVFWRQFYAMFMAIMRNLGVSLTYLQVRLFLMGYRINPRDGFMFICGEYALGLGCDGVEGEIPWGLSCKSPWKDERNKVSFKEFMEVNEELTLMGMGMFLAVHPSEEMFDTTCGVTHERWMAELVEMYDRGSDAERSTVLRYAKYFGKDADIELTIADKVSASVAKVKPSTEERIEIAIKNMKDWTEEDFWNEMTELLAQSKAEKDSKQIMRIMEMKAKAMGLLKEDNKGTNFTLVMMREQANALIEKHGIADKRTIIDV